MQHYIFPLQLFVVVRVWSFAFIQDLTIFDLGDDGDSIATIGPTDLASDLNLWEDNNNNLVEDPNPDSNSLFSLFSDDDEKSHTPNLLLAAATAGVDGDSCSSFSSSSSTDESGGLAAATSPDELLLFSKQKQNQRRNDNNNPPICPSSSSSSPSSNDQMMLKLPNLPKTLNDFTNQLPPPPPHPVDPISKKRIIWADPVIERFLKSGVRMEDDDHCNEDRRWWLCCDCHPNFQGAYCVDCVPSESFEIFFSKSFYPFFSSASFLVWLNLCFGLNIVDL